MKSSVLFCFVSLMIMPSAKASGVSHSLLNSLDQLLVRNQFSPFHRNSPKLVQRMMLNQVYEADDLKSAVFIKWGVPKRKKRFTIRKLHGGTEVYLYKTAYSLAVYFHNVPTPFRERVTGLLKGLSRAPSSEVTDVNILPESEVKSSHWQIAKKCFMQTIDQVKGELSGAWKGLKSAASSVWDGKFFSQFWGQLKKVWKNLKKVVSIFKSKMGELLKVIANLRSEDVRKLLCAFTGTVVLPMAASLLGGAGIARLAARLSTMIPKIQSISKVLAAYSAASASVRASIPLEKLIKNALNKGDWLTERMNRLLRKGHSEAAFGVGACR